MISQLSFSMYKYPALLQSPSPKYCRIHWVMASHPQNQFIPQHIHENLVFPSITTQKFCIPLPPPGKIDCWLTSITRTGGNILFLKDYLLLEDVAKEHVICQVEHIIIKVSHLYIYHWLADYLIQYCKAPDNGTIFKDADTHVLCITAHILSNTKAYVLLRHSPRAILETFMGDSSEWMAPEWTHWANPVHKFQQPLSSFAHLFMCMVYWDCNVMKVSGYLMIKSVFGYYSQYNSLVYSIRCWSGFGLWMWVSWYHKLCSAFSDLH